jgi:serine/threonine protein kinase
LGQGGMGAVFKARHTLLKSHHAVKIILPDLVGNDPNLVTRFRQEALAAAAIRHQNIIAVTDFGVVRGTIPFLVMEFIQGKSLQEIMAEEGAMPHLRACELIQPVCAGIAAAHRQGIVHRDLKPLNVMIRDGVPISEGLKILDFGLAKIKSAELLGSFIAAQTTGVMGSPHYMAPEQWSDEPQDARADIYSLGAMFYQMLCGEVPFKGNSIAAIMKKHLTVEAPSLASQGVEVPPQIEAVVRHALEKDPQYRTPSAEEFANELREAMTSAHTTLKLTEQFGKIDPGKTIASEPAPGGTAPLKVSTPDFDPLAETVSAPSLLKSFNPVKVFRRYRLIRVGAGLLLLAGAAFAQYKLVKFPRPMFPVSLETTGKFPATIKPGKAELIIEGPAVDSKDSEGAMLFSHDGVDNEIANISFESARLHEQTVEFLKGLKYDPPITRGKFVYQARELMSSARGKPCHTHVEILAASKMPDEIHIFQLRNPGVEAYPHFEMTIKGAELVANLGTSSPDDSEGGPGCQYVMKVGAWEQPINNNDVSAVMSDNSELHLSFIPVMPNSNLWSATGGFVLLDLPQSSQSDQSHIQARSVSIKSLDPANPDTLLSAQSLRDGPLLSIEELKIGPDQIQVSVLGKGLVEISGEPKTDNFSDRIREHKRLAALLAAANIVLLALVALLIFKTPKLALAQTP